MPLVAAGIHEVRSMSRSERMRIPHLNTHSIVRIAEGIFDTLLSPWQLREWQPHKLEQPHQKNMCLFKKNQIENEGALDCEG